MPNLALRTRDVDAFEDTSLEYVRAEMHVSKVATPRPATADVVKALRGISSDSESATISLALEWIGGAIMDASGGRMENQDAVVYLFEVVTTRSGTLAVRLVLRVDCT